MICDGTVPLRMSVNIIFSGIIDWSIIPILIEQKNNEMDLFQHFRDILIVASEIVGQKHVRM